MKDCYQVSDLKGAFSHHDDAKNDTHVSAWLAVLAGAFLVEADDDDEPTKSFAGAWLAAAGAGTGVDGVEAMPAEIDSKTAVAG